MKRADLRTALQLFAAAFVIRCLPLGSVFAEGQVFLRDGDAYYHLRRALFAIENFPQTLSFDRYVQFPHGSKIIWPAFLDSCLALVLWPFYEMGGIDLATRAASWIPPVLGALTVVATWAVMKRAFGERAALWAGGLLCVLGGHFVYSRMGALDHHVVVSLLSVALLGATLRMLSAPGLRTRGWACACGTLAGISLLVWPGSLLYVALVLIGLAAAAIFAADRESAAARWHELAWVSGCAALVVSPFSLGNEWPQWTSMSPVVLTNFQPWLLLSATALALLGAAAATRIPSAADPRGRALHFIGGGALCLALSLMISADLMQGFADAWRWLGKDESFQSSVLESQALFMVRGRFSVYMANLQLSPLLYLFPFLWLYGCYEARRAEAPAPRVFLLAWTAALFAITLVQKRFLDTFSVAFAMQTALSLEALWRRANISENGIVSRLAPLAVIAALFPMHANYTPHLDNLLRAFQDEPLKLSTYHRADRIFHGVSRWLSKYTPHTSGWLDPDEEPEYAILARWTTGHMIQHVGRRPTVTDNFGDDAGAENFALEQRFWSAQSQVANGILERLGVRYVVVTDGDPFAKLYDHYSMFRALFLRDGGGILAAPDKASTRASGRYRLLMESQPLTARARRPFAKVFEFVPGARLHGKTRADTHIGVSLSVRTNRGRRFQYRDRIKAGPNGEFEFSVPYANSGGPDWMHVADGYAVRCRLRARRVEVSEAQVQSGASIWVGDPCQAPPASVGKRFGRR